MNDSPNLPDELAAKWLAGEADEAEIRQLLDACKADPEFLASLVDLVEIDRLLPLLEDAPEVFVDELRDRLHDVPDSDRFAQAVSKRIGKRRRPAVLPFLGFIVAAAVMLMFILPGQESPAPDTGNPVTVVPAPAPLATITTTVAAAWEQGFAPRNGELASGPYRLLRGVVSMRFDSGVEVIVEGPAEFAVADAERVMLVDGTMTAHVPDGAEGFIVDTSSTRVIDRGTEFAVSASRTGDTEVHVLDGIVDAHPLADPGGMIRLLENEARIFQHGGPSAVATADPTRFYRQLPHTESSISWLHWSFDEGAGDSTMGVDHGLVGRNVVAEFATIGDKKPGPQWIDGPYGAAITFDGRDDYLQTDYEGIGGTHARTVAFWVRVPTDWRTKEGYGMVSWGSYEYEGATWQISANPIADEGPVGRLRVGTNRGQAIGETDLRDGRWHHVAVVMYGGGDANVATHVILYLDGEYERASRKSVLDINTDVDSSTSRKVQIGRNSSLQKKSHRCFRGALDEVYLIGAALDQEQIRRLMANQPIGQ